ncbi:hypothetical protein MMYC01_201970 [Madurella mycetomatis]|uniref:Uncharacterized protein n=1 Tax=Madurella mycetomatis TaxID=100816 RepID=A0A175WFL4_9PEZI|nr:hypothetical protein MMYC01_201970 [Madurella mycetomatis]
MLSGEALTVVTRISFCRKTTMVKHQRRSHQRGIHSSEMEDSMSESGTDESPSTPKSHTAIPWPTQHLPMMAHPGSQVQRAVSLGDFNPHINGYNLQQQYNHRHSLSGGPAEYHGAPHSQPTPLHDQSHQPLLQRTVSMPHHSYFVDQNNPGVATMNPNAHAANQHPQYQQIPRQGVERLPLEIPFSNGPGLTGGMQSSPNTFSPASGRSPPAQETGFYTHSPPHQPTYALHAASPVEPQPQMMSFQGQMPSAAAQAMAQPRTTQTVQHPQAPPHHQAAGPPQPSPPEVYQQQPPHSSQPPAPEEQQWYSGIPYQAPVEVQTIGTLPAYGTGFDPWAVKMEYEDPSMQLPSARISTM